MSLFFISNISLPWDIMTVSENTKMKIFKYIKTLRASFRTFFSLSPYFSTFFCVCCFFHSEMCLGTIFPFKKNPIWKWRSSPSSHDNVNKLLAWIIFSVHSIRRWVILSAWKQTIAVANVKPNVLVIYICSYLSLWIRCQCGIVKYSIQLNLVMCSIYRQISFVRK